MGDLIRSLRLEEITGVRCRTWCCAGYRIPQSPTSLCSSNRLKDALLLRLAAAARPRGQASNDGVMGFPLLFLFCFLVLNLIEAAPRFRVNCG